MTDKPVDCIRVDGATDEGPSILEVQFLWTEVHLVEEKICTCLTARNSGGSYLESPRPCTMFCFALIHPTRFYWLVPQY